MNDKERDALMRLTMCARNECVICKYENEYTDIQCYELQTKCMSILAESLNSKEQEHENAPIVFPEPRHIQRG